MTKSQNIIIISATVSAIICVILILAFFQRMKQSIMGTITNNYFTDKELYQSSTANKNNIDNKPQSNEIIENLRALRDNILNPAREKYGSCIYINCAYRCPALNALVGGVSNSQHTTGQAADITTKSNEGNKKLFKILVEQGNYDQLIWEGNGAWIHVSYTKTPRKNILAQTPSGGYTNINYNWQTYIA